MSDFENHILHMNSTNHRTTPLIELTFIFAIRQKWFKSENTFVRLSLYFLYNLIARFKREIRSLIPHLETLLKGDY